jgi:hypothetical protein
MLALHSAGHDALLEMRPGILLFEDLPDEGLGAAAQSVRRARAMIDLDCCELQQSRHCQTRWAQNQYQIGEAAMNSVIKTIPLAPSPPMADSAFSVEAPPPPAPYDIPGVPELDAPLEAL